MNYNFRRGRSPPPPPQPPFGYDGSMRPMPNQRDFDSPYHPMNPYEGPGRPPVGKISQSPMSPIPSHPSQLAPPMATHPYMDVPARHHNYQPHYREQLYGPPQQPPPPPPPQPSNPYRSAIGHRDPYLSGGSSSSQPPHHHHQYPPRPSSPPYKILCVTNINHKIDDVAVKEVLTSDFSRFGDISVSVCHDNGERLAYIYFRNCDEAREARQIKTRTLLFDKPIEIEPIYEPTRNAGSPGNMSPAGPVPPPTYSPRKRSVSPSGYSREPNVPMARRPPPPHLQHGDIPVGSPNYPLHRGSTPPDYSLNSGGYHRGPSPPPPMAPASIHPPYDRRAHHGGYNPYSPSHTAPAYTSPPHEPHRPGYSSHSMPYPAPGHQRERERGYGERMHRSSRSPHHDPYYPPEPRDGPPPGMTPRHHQPLSSMPGRHPSRSSRHSNIPPGPYRDEHIAARHRYPPEPRARFMSREYRREKFGSDPYPADHDEGRPSRVLLVNNIDATKTELDLKELFEPFGIVEEMETKKVAPDISSALVKFSSMDGAYKAKTANNGRHIGTLRCRIVYGKVTASRRLWIGGLSPSWTVSMMEDECGKYGDLVSIDYTSGRPYCYVDYETANQAQFAAYHMRSTLTPASERKIRIEFVDPDRSEKLVPRHHSNSHASETNSKPRTATESTGEIDASPRSTGGLSSCKRSVSPASDLSNSKRVCQPGELPLAANTFKQERLVAAAAAKARTSSTTSSTASLDKSGSKISDTNDGNELNNNSDDKQVTGNGSIAPKDQNLSTEATSQEAPSLELLSRCLDIMEVVGCCSVSWPSQIALRNFIFPAQIHMCSGKKQLIDRYLTRPTGDNGHCKGPLLRITQRWRLHPQPKLEEVKRRMQSGNLGILIFTARQDSSIISRHAASAAVAAELLTESAAHDDSGQQVASRGEDYSGDQPGIHENGPTQQNGDAINRSPDKASESVELNDSSLKNNTARGDSVATSGAPGPSTPNHVGTPPTSSSTQSRPLRNLISYLEQKDAAGVISLSASTETNGEQTTPAEGSSSSTKLLYAFPPGDFAFNLLKRKVPNLSPETTKDEYLLGVIVGGNVEGGKI